MKITKVATVPVGSRRLIVKLETDAGLVGLGEPGTGGLASSCAVAIQQLESYLMGKDPRRIVHHWQGMLRHASHRGGWLLTSALSGVGQALWDLAGKAAGLPVHTLLGADCRDRIRLCGPIRGDTPQSVAESVRQSRAAGFTAGKYAVPRSWSIHLTDHSSTAKAGPGLERILAALGAMREAGGPGYDLAIDLGGIPSPRAASFLMQALEPFHLLYVEDPISCQDVDGLGQLSAQTSIRVAGGAQMVTKSGFQELLDKKAVAVIQLDISRAGGISEGRLIAGPSEYRRIAPTPWADRAGRQPSAGCEHPEPPDSGNDGQCSGFPEWLQSI